MAHKISADWGELALQAKMTGGGYFDAAKRELSESGMIYTAAEVVALAGIMAAEFRTTSIGVAAQNIAESIDNLADAVRELDQPRT